MINRTSKVAAFLTVWLFAFSLLSNCYCFPSYSTSVLKAQPARHCEHHAGQAGNPQKKHDCAPRYNTDQFENASIAQKVLKAPAFSVLNVVEAVSVHKDFVSQFSRDIESPPVSPPEFFVLHHSFLI